MGPGWLRYPQHPLHPLVVTPALDGCLAPGVATKHQSNGTSNGWEPGRNIAEMAGLILLGHEK